MRVRATTWAFWCLACGVAAAAEPASANLPRVSVASFRHDRPAAEGEVEFVLALPADAPAALLDVPLSVKIETSHVAPGPEPVRVTWRKP